jgi:hypothetical protein
VKRRDPSHGANAPPKAVAVPPQGGQDAEPKSQPCLDLVCKPVAQPPAQASLKASLNNPAAVTPWTALLRGRKLRLPWRMASGSRQPPRGERLMSARERESGELPSPEFPVRSQDRAGFSFLRGRIGPPRLRFAHAIRVAAFPQSPPEIPLARPTSFPHNLARRKYHRRKSLWAKSSITSSKPSATRRSSA